MGGGWGITWANTHIYHKYHDTDLRFLYHFKHGNDVFFFFQVTFNREQLKKKDTKCALVSSCPKLISSTCHISKNSVSDPFHFDADADPRIRFVEKRIRIRPKIEKIPAFFITFFLLITQIMIIMLFYEPIILWCYYIFYLR